MKALKYSTGECPKFGDLVRGVPNRSDKAVAGIVTTAAEDVIRVAYFKPGSADPEVTSVYGCTQHFELLARNAEQ